VFGCRGLASDRSARRSQRVCCSPITLCALSSSQLSLTANSLPKLRSPTKVRHRQFAVSTKTAKLPNTTTNPNPRVFLANPRVFDLDLVHSATVFQTSFAIVSLNSSSQRRRIQRQPFAAHCRTDFQRNSRITLN
jgi:hypothetical protein